MIHSQKKGKLTENMPGEAQMINEFEDRSTEIPSLRSRKKKEQRKINRA